ncbi:unnamed protein product, partial [Prorocentrum cordatum]
PSRARSPAARRARAAGAAAGMSGEPAAAVGRPGEEVALAGLLAPLGGQLTLGSTLGYCAGVALRFAGRIAAGGVGASFCLIQGLSYSGYIQVDWRKVERDYVKILDQNGDGKVDTDDLVLAWHRVRDCLAFNLPAGAGFTAGLAYGLGATFGTSWKARRCCRAWPWAAWGRSAPRRRWWACKACGARPGPPVRGACRRPRGRRSVCRSSWASRRSGAGGRRG